MDCGESGYRGGERERRGWQRGGEGLAGYYEGESRRNNLLMKVERIFADDGEC